MCHDLSHDRKVQSAVVLSIAAHEACRAKCTFQVNLQQQENRRGRCWHA